MPESTVRLMHYDPRWRQEFQQTRSSVLQSCEGWVTQVEHIGSTAIPGLIARPMIDCIASVRPDNAIGDHLAVEHDAFEPATTSIEGLNFRRVDAPAWVANSVLLVKPRHGEPTHRVILTRLGSDLWRHAIGIREFLIANPEHAVRFEEAKVSRWRSGEGDPRQYELDKSLFFSHLIDQIDATSSDPDSD